MPEASRVEDEIKSAYSGADIKLIEGRGGTFIVTLDNRIIYSKLDRIGTDTERFPKPMEIVTLIENSLGK